MKTACPSTATIVFQLTSSRDYVSHNDLPSFARMLSKSESSSTRLAVQCHLKREWPTSCHKTTKVPVEIYDCETDVRQTKLINLRPSIIFSRNSEKRSTDCKIGHKRTRVFISKFKHFY